MICFTRRTYGTLKNSYHSYPGLKPGATYESSLRDGPPQFVSCSLKSECTGMPISIPRHAGEKSGCFSPYSPTRCHSDPAYGGRGTRLFTAISRIGLLRLLCGSMYWLFSASAAALCVRCVKMYLAVPPNPQSGRRTFDLLSSSFFILP